MQFILKTFSITGGIYIFDGGKRGFVALDGL